MEQITEVIAPGAIEEIVGAQKELEKLIELQKQYNNELLRTKANKQGDLMVDNR